VINIDISIETTKAVRAVEVAKTNKYITLVEPRLQDILQWLKQGMNEYSIAEKLGICNDTWIEYRGKYPVLSKLYTQAQDSRNCLVVNAVLKRSLGYDYDETTTDRGEVTKTVTKHVPGDVNAQKFYLINRDPANWQPENRLESSNITINNYQLPELETKRQQILAEIQRLELNAAIDVECTKID